MSDKTSIQWTDSTEAILSRVRAGDFEVDAAGRVWRLHDGRGGACRRRAENRTSLGYLMVRTMLGGRRVHALAHRVVYAHLVGPIPDGFVVNHLNGTKDDNRPENLEATTYSGNTTHAVRVLGKMDQHGERNHRSKLTREAVADIRSRRTRGESLVAIGAAHGVAMQTVSKVCRGDRWKDQDLRVREFPAVRT